MMHSTPAIKLSFKGLNYLTGPASEGSGPLPRIYLGAARVTDGEINSNSVGVAIDFT